RPKELKLSAVTRIVVAAPSCPLGGYTRTYLENLGLYETLLPRTTIADNSRAVVAAIQARRADAGIIYSSDASAAVGCQILFRAGKRCPPIRFQAAVVRGEQSDHARALLHFLSSPTANRRFRQCGFLPPTTPRT